MVFSRRPGLGRFAEPGGLWLGCQDPPLKFVLQSLKNNNNCPSCASGFQKFAKNSIMRRIPPNKHGAELLQALDDALKDHVQEFEVRFH